MPYARPPLIVRRFFNPIAMRFGLGGSEALSIQRRKSGGTQRIPVIPVTVDGERYLVCPRGETHWVRNLRAAGEGRLGPHGDERPFVATEVPIDRRSHIIEAYRKVAGRAVKSFFSDNPDPKDHPTFRIDSY